MTPGTEAIEMAHLLKIVAIGILGICAIMLWTGLDLSDRCRDVWEWFKYEKLGYLRPESSLTYAHYQQILNPTCDLPPDGWRCTRGKGHEGPCAALPTGVDTTGMFQTEIR